MNIEEIKQKYNIKTDGPEEIKSELLKRIKQNHPDESNYRTVDDNIDITDLIEDYNYIQSLIGTDRKQEVSIPINEVVKAFTEIMQMPTKKEKEQVEVLSEKLNTSISNQVMATRRKLSFRRYSSASITAIITFLWLFPNQVLEHPFVKMFVGDYQQGRFMTFILAAWLFTLVATCISWMSAKHIENIENDLTKHIALESVQNTVFMNFIDNIAPECSFVKPQFVEYLASYIYRKMYMPRIRHRYQLNIGLKKRIQEDVIQNMADIILLRAQEHGVIRKVKSNSLIDSFEIIIDQESE